jgi:hypothetical protein
MTHHPCPNHFAICAALGSLSSVALSSAQMTVSLSDPSYFRQFVVLTLGSSIPYEVAGDTQDSLNPKDFMLVCGSCNRAKSWSCEHCANWQNEKSSQVCLKCYWANPENYVHVALREIRRTDILWDENEVELYEKLKTSAAQNQFRIPEYVKQVIENHLGKTKGG